jgi:ribose/xylose/arabinose/galactoside ABC-type transport system permease subunit
MENLAPEWDSRGSRVIGSVIASGQSFLHGRSLFGPPGIYFALAGLIFVTAIVEPTVVSRQGITQLLAQNAAIGMLAVGQTLVMLTGGIDLSVGSVVAVTNWVAVNLLLDNTARTVPVLFACMGIGLGIGAVNGIGIAIFRVPPFVMTLGMLFAVKAAGLMYTNGILIGKPSRILVRAYDTSILGLPVPFVVLLSTVVVTTTVLRTTSYGRRVYAIGANPDAAYLAGVRTHRVLIVTYMLCGLCAAIGGLLWTGFIEIGSNSAGLNFELQAIAAAVIAGTALMGGKGSPVATLAGVLFLGLLFNLLVVLDVNEAVRFILQGGAIVAATAVYARTRLRR